MEETFVMVVDDEKIVCDRLKEHLELNGYRVDAFTDSEEALVALETKPYRVVVTDLTMAGPSGMDVLASVRDRGLPAQVIIITDYGSAEAPREAEAVGAFDFISKPFELKDLTAKVKNAASAGWRVNRTLRQGIFRNGT